MIQNHACVLVSLLVLFGEAPDFDVLCVLVALASVDPSIGESCRRSVSACVDALYAFNTVIALAQGLVNLLMTMPTTGTRWVHVDGTSIS